jgi:hypothetical protein
MAKLQITPGFVTSPLFRPRGQRTSFYPDPALTAEHCETMRNVNLSDRGAVGRRHGYAPYNINQITETAVAVPVVGLHQQAYSTGETRNIVVAGTKIYAADTTTAWASLDITGGLTVTNASNNRVRTVYIDNKAVQTNGANPAWYVGPTGNAAVVAGVPFTKCEDFVVHRNLLVALNTTEGSTSFPTRARWCDVNRKTFVIDISTWRDDNRFEINDDGPPIIGGNDNFGRLLIFKQDGLYPCMLQYSQGYIEMVLLEDQVYRGFSPVAKHSILARPEFTWVVCKEGAYAIIPSGDGFETRFITQDLKYDWLNSLNQARIKNAVSYIRERDHQVRTLLSSSDTSSGFDLEMVYDWDTGSVWFDEPSTDMNYATSFEIDSAEYDFKGTLDGYVLQANDAEKTTDDGTPFFWNIKMAPNDLGHPGKEKLIHTVETVYQTTSGVQTVEANIYLDEQRSSTRSKVVTLGSSQLYDTGLLYNTGLKYPGGTTDMFRVFVNRVAATVAPQWRGFSDFTVIGYRVTYQLLEN